MTQAGLVLEGGGMRGVYTAGVLEYFLEKDLYFPYNIGVSAGACNAVSYLSRQKDRNRKVNIDYIHNPSYLSLRNYIKKRELFGMDFIFDEIPNKLVPFDYEAFYKAEESFEVGTTDCVTGEPVYYNKHQHGKDMLMILRASSSLPFAAPIVEFDQRCLLDGGISDPIPIKRAEEVGFEKNVVILTRNKGYQKKPSRQSWISSRLYKNYPGLLKSMDNRADFYNETLQYIYDQEEQGKVFIIQPSKPLKVGRVERNQNRLTQLFNEGYEDGKNLYTAVMDWIHE
ncbi:putative patatin/cPLA2 family phospholipase [Bacillus mesophilus]|uniref:Patatin family protein n=1 Tax=Bacillus mesophilus TaxID=1808955 RepID=A0A6M0Q2T0_9BACI|nr:patatin family protein [Bacillus mesophilus]MBM7659625.1 putative patatin/cPLA2 family phospholipase [Bacillus mesophilus]NEY70494.1 patatin family protein [Bacillus mesophilus]